jgi:hypothetical protein
MRKLTLLPFFLLGVMVFSLSCKKESHDMIPLSAPGETLNVKIAPNQSYQLDLADAGTVSISRQAIHFLVSDATANNENGALVYKYIPATDFTGNDEVVLLATKTVVNYTTSNNGGCPASGNGYTTSVTNKSISLKITVGN